MRQTPFCCFHIRNTGVDAPRSFGRASGSAATASGFATATAPDAAAFGLTSTAATTVIPDGCLTAAGLRFSNQDVLTANNILNTVIGSAFTVCEGRAGCVCTALSVCSWLSMSGERIGLVETADRVRDVAKFPVHRLLQTGQPGNQADDKQ
jgi:hypothetical protein